MLIYAPYRALSIKEGDCIRLLKTAFKEATTGFLATLNTLFQIVWPLVAYATYYDVHNSLILSSILCMPAVYYFTGLIRAASFKIEIEDQRKVIENQRALLDIRSKHKGPLKAPLLFKR